MLELLFPEFICCSHNILLANYTKTFVLILHVYGKRIAAIFLFSNFHNIRVYLKYVQGERVENESSKRIMLETWQV